VGDGGKRDRAICRARADGFIFRQLNGTQCNETSCGQGTGDENLNQAIYAQRDAIFRGGEAQFQWDLQKLKGGFVGVDGLFDIVRATFTDGSNVPRIPPQRLGGGIYWRSDEWYARFAERYRAVRTRADTGIQSAQGGGQPHDEIQERPFGIERSHGRRGRQ
jgi:hypothetical protein